MHPRENFVPGLVDFGLQGFILGFQVYQWNGCSQLFLSPVLWMIFLSRLPSAKNEPGYPPQRRHWVHLS